MLGTRVRDESGTRIRVVRLAFTAVLLSVIGLSAAHAAERMVGTCLTLEGVRLGPFTDAADPACGADCGDEDVPDAPDDELCGDDACGVDELAATRLPPAGPRCLEPGPTCSPGSDGLPTAFFFAGGNALSTAPIGVPVRGDGTLPGPEPGEHAFSVREFRSTREPPPPRG